MENVVFTQLSVTEIRKLLREELEGYFSTTNYLQHNDQPEPDSLLSIQQAADFLHLSVPTLYGKVHNRELPFSKRGKRLYFSKSELTEWVKSGQRKTQSELDAEARDFVNRKGK